MIFIDTFLLLLFYHSYLLLPITFATITQAASHPEDSIP